MTTPMNAYSRPTLQALWNLRLLALFLLGPMLGIVLVETVFGMPPGLYLLGAAMFLFSSSTLLVLVKAERRRIITGGSHSRRRGSSGILR